MGYKLFRPLLFSLPAECAHNLALGSLGLAGRLNLAKVIKSPASCSRDVMGLHFANPVGLAAGFDKDATAIDGLGALGFGCIEVGTVTPKSQRGNKPPRLFRIPEHQALINHMGFNSKGVDFFATRIRQRKYPGILGVNIGINESTVIADAADDFIKCLVKVYAMADYISINISSPNTKNLRDLQQKKAMRRLLSVLDKKRQELASQYAKRKPLVIKISPDLDDYSLAEVIETLAEVGIDGVIASNTSVSRHKLKDTKWFNHEGGLSGAPLLEQSLQCIQRIRGLIGNALSVIGCGGVMQPPDAVEILNAGGDLVQIYTGLIYSGPGLPRAMIKAVLDNDKAQQLNFD